MVSGKIGEQSGKFILDTGAPYLVLNQTYFKNAQASNVLAAGVSGKVKVAKMQIESLEVTGYTWQNLNADVVSLSQVENSKSTKILGLLGVQLFVNKILTIDYANGQLFVADKESQQFVAKGETIIEEKLTVYDNRLITKVNIAGKKQLTCIDTGAEACVLHNKQKNKVWEQIDVKGRYLMAGVGSQRAEVLSAVVKQLEFGDKEISNVRTIVSNLDGLSEAYGFEVRFVMGYTILSGYLVTLNFVDNKVVMSRHAQ